MSSADESRIEPAVVAEMYAKHRLEMHAFLVGVLRDTHLASDALQATFAKAIELGHTVAPASFKAWLFRVAFTEALAMRRRQQSQERLLEQIAWTRPGAADCPIENAVRSETVEAIRAALEELPAEQRLVVQQRIYEQKTFAAIAEEFGVPLGTVLTRMQLALRKLRAKLEQSSKE